MNREALKSNIKLGLIIAASLILILMMIFTPDKFLADVKTVIGSSGSLGFVFSIILYGLLGASPIPSEPLTVLISGLFGPLEATWIACLGNLVAAIIEYLIGQKIGDVADFEQKKSKLPFRLGEMPVDSPMFLIAGRMLPGIGPKVISLISGVYRVKLWRFIWTTFISLLLGAALVAYGASGLLNLVR